MSTETLDHDTIAARAHQIWNSYGQPSGREDEIWLEAERQLHAETTEAARNSPHKGGHTKSEAESDIAKTQAAAQQRKEARAPIVPHKTAPKQKPAETGKPVWDKPHSS